jgi:probable rRNA maturation factor
VGCEDGVEVPVREEWLEAVSAGALQAAGVVGEVEVALLLAGDETLHRLNRQYRGVDRPTDVLSFAQEEDGPAPFQAPPEGPRHLGDVAISVERVRRQADDHGHSFEREFGYLLTHGVLHLVGYDHEADAAQAEMRRLEEQALAALGLGRVQNAKCKMQNAETGRSHPGSGVEGRAPPAPIEASQ